MSLESEFPASSSRRSCSLFVPFMHVVTHIKDHDDDDDDENRRRRITMATLARSDLYIGAVGDISRCRHTLACDAIEQSFSSYSPLL